jgi:hypothetical protein
VLTDYHYIVAGIIFAMEPAVIRMGRLRAKAQAARRAQQRQPANEGPLPNVAPAVIPFRVAVDPQERARRREARDMARRREADRLNAQMSVIDAAENFIRAIRDSVAQCAEYEAQGFDPTECTMQIDPPPPPFLEGIDERGRALVLRMRIVEPILEWNYSRRTRALTQLTTHERREFLDAVLDHSHIDLDCVREARSLFARCLRAARARDDAASVRAMSDALSRA